MSGIKRWFYSELHNEIRQEDHGKYVLHSDHEAVVDSMTAALVKLDSACLASEQEVARLRADLEGYMMGAAAEAREVDARGEEIKRLRAELQNAVKAALDAMALSCEKEREADALRVDAERYRWLRGRAGQDDGEVEVFIDSESWAPGHLDSQIDAAMGASA